MATYTTNYQLHQWEASDDFLRTDFNADFAKIDVAIKGVETAANTALAGKASQAALEAVQAALAGKAVSAGGGYTGNGGVTTINLGFQPKAVVVSSGYYTAVSPFGVPNTGITVTATGFQVQQISSNVTFNMAGYPYTYAAV